MNTFSPSAPHFTAESPPRIMGILNVTPDSFSDGGRYSDLDAAVAQGISMLEQGADLIDVGGESTRPGARPIPAAEQERRVIAVIRQLREQIAPAVPISIDTTSAQVASAAIDAGASWINDTSAGVDDPRMLPLAAERDVPIVLMHRQGRPQDMQVNPCYVDVVREVCDALARRADAARHAGIREHRILLDPGIGFGKRAEHNLALLARLGELVRLGFPVLLGTSRKRFMADLCGGSEPAALMPATCATTAIGVMAGARIFRVHDVAGNRQAADLAWAIRHAV
ncbi:dihydropteroate synthase [Thiocystis minor]|uniref:dihydropteroate synthase n=1 Tax=Thiocystis minor TaxID=61597 RepID=UPI001914261F|nr:dihydropteroate synthase [Thiocystis minor]MBK5964375.1 dihydropteroate synthase [Thiocystis minor]